MGCAWVIDYLWSISVLHYYSTPLHKRISIRKNKNIALSIKSIEIFGWNGNLVFYLGLPPPNLIFVRVKSFIYFGFGSIGSIWASHRKLPLYSLLYFRFLFLDSGIAGRKRSVSSVLSLLNLVTDAQKGRFAVLWDLERSTKIHGTQPWLVQPSLRRRLFLLHSFSECLHLWLKDQLINFGHGT